jgi:hypothetical protein
MIDSMTKQGWSPLGGHQGSEVFLWAGKPELASPTWQTSEYI